MRLLWKDRADQKLAKTHKIPLTERHISIKMTTDSKIE